MSQILKLSHENQQLKRQINQYQQVLGVSPYVDDSLFKGGYRVVKTIVDRDAIKCCWRKQGMKVVVIGEDLSFKEYVLKTDNCKENIWEEINVTVEENEVFLIEDYSELGENLTTQKELNLVLKQLILNLQTQIDNIELIDEKVQITENTNFGQIGDNQKDFNKKVSDYKVTVDSKNIEQDERIENLEGINYIWSPTGRTLTLYDNNGNQLSQVSLLSLDNEGTDIRYNASTLSLELYNADNELLDSIPVSSFIGSVGTQLQLNSNQLQLRDSQGNILSTVSFVVSNIQGLQTALDSRLNKGSYTGNASDLKNEIDSKLNKPTTTSTTASYPYVVGENGNGGSARLPAGDLGKNFFNSDLSNTTARNHTMNAGITVNTLGNPHTLSGLPNKNTDIANFRKVRVQNTSGLDSVVDSKNLLTDGVTSMSDAEKDAWRLAQRKTGENYSTGQPRIDFILPFKLSKSISGIQYFSCIGSNLLLNLSDCQVKLINTSTNAEYPISVVNTSASTTSNFSIGYDISSLPTGSYKIYVRNGFNINIDNTTFDVVDNIQYFDMSSITWQKNVLTSGDFTGSTAIGGNINRQSPNITGEPSTNVRKIEFLSSEILNALEANRNFIIEIDFSRYRTDQHNPSYLGLVDSTVNSLNGNGQIIFGWASLSGGGNRTILFPTSVTAGGGSSLAQESGKVVISKKGSIIQMMAILSGTIYITTNISQSNSYTGLKLMYFDFGISSAFSGAQQTYSIKLYK